MIKVHYYFGDYGLYRPALDFVEGADTDIEELSRFVDKEMRTREFETEEEASAFELGIDACASSLDLPEAYGAFYFRDDDLKRMKEAIDD